MSDQRLAVVVKIGSEAEHGLGAAIDFLTTLPAPRNSDDRFRIMWPTLLAVLAADIGPAAIELGQHGSVRAARILNRSLLEYAGRLHYYHRHWDEAVEHGKESDNLLRRIAKPLASAQGREPRLKAAKAFVEAGSTSATMLRFGEMERAMCENFDLPPSLMGQYVLWLEADYALSTFFSHGSGGALYEAFGRSEESERVGVRRSAVAFHRFDEVLRSGVCMIVLLAGIEMQCGRDFGGLALRDELQALRPIGEDTTPARYNALLPLLGIPLTEGKTRSV